MNKVLLSFTTALLITGCASSISSFDGVKESAEKAIYDAKRHSVDANPLPHVRYTDNFFVPALKKNEEDKPQWFMEETNDRLLDFTLAEVMNAKFAPLGVNIRYIDNVNPELRFSLSHEGTLGELLHKISFATKYSYTIQGDLLTWSKFQTKSLDIQFIAGKTDYLFGTKDGKSSNTSNQQQNTGFGGSTGAPVVTDHSFSDTDEFISFSTEGLSVWSDLASTLDLLKSDEGRYFISQATSTVVVKDYPDNVQAIEKYINTSNDKITKMIAIDVEIFEYTANEGDQRGINWNVVKQDLATGGVFGLQSAFNSLVESNLPPTVLGYSQESGKYAGSQVLLNILDKYGAVSEQKKRRIVGLNNQVSKVDIGGMFGYLAQSGGTSTANVGSQDNLTPGTLRTGNSIFMLPSVADDKIVIQLSTKFSKLEEIRNVVSGDRRIETPQTSDTELFLKFAIQEGQTLLITGTTDSRLEYTENTTGGLIALGGELGGSQSTKETLILFTPRVVYQ